MTTEDHLRLLIGDLVLTIARLQAELDALRAAKPPTTPVPMPDHERPPVVAGQVTEP